MAMPGMGALPFDGGCGFRVWAPHATGVTVMGDFNWWNGGSHWLSAEGNGYFYGEVPGARIGDHYKFVIFTPNGVFDRIDPWAREVTNSVGHGVIHDHGWFDWQGDDYDCPSHHELVIYEMHVGSFVGGWEGSVGTFHSLVEKLGHFEHLGVNAVQLMPVMEFAGDRSWGYNPAHIFAVESAYGGPDGLKTFVREAHKRGIAVLLDVVYNHFGPSDLDLWRFDGWSENDKGGIYFYNDGRASTPWGETRPDYGRPEVRSFIRENALMWLRDYHIDGLRYDMTAYMRSVDGRGDDLPDGWSLMREINEAIRAEFPGRILIAEDLRGESHLSSTGPDGAHFHAQWDPGFVHPVRRAATTPFDGDRSLAEVRDAVARSYGDAFQRVIYTESHDEVSNGRSRVPHEVNPWDPTGWHAQKRSTLAASLVFTSPGIPMLFQGQEFLQGGWFRDDVPLDWYMNDRFQGIVRLYRDLVRLRRNFEDDTRGLRGHGLDVYHVHQDMNILAFHRWEFGGPHDDVVVVANLGGVPRGDYRIGMPAAGLWRLKFNSDARNYSEIFSDHPATDVVAWDEPQDGKPARAALEIGPYSVLVYSRA